MLLCLTVWGMLWSVDNAAKYVVCGCHVCGCHEQFLYQTYEVGISANPSTTSLPLTYQLSRTNILPSFYTFVTILVGNKYSRSQTSCWCCRGLSRRSFVRDSRWGLVLDSNCRHVGGDITLSDKRRNSWWCTQTFVPCLTLYLTFSICVLLC